MILWYLTGLCILLLWNWMNFEINPFFVVVVLVFDIIRYSTFCFWAVRFNMTTRCWLGWSSSGLTADRWEPCSPSFLPPAFQVFWARPVAQAAPSLWSQHFQDGRCAACWAGCPRISALFQPLGPFAEARRAAAQLVGPRQIAGDYCRDLISDGYHHQLPGVTRLIRLLGRSQKLSINSWLKNTAVSLSKALSATSAALSKKTSGILDFRQLSNEKWEFSTLLLY